MLDNREGDGLHIIYLSQSLTLSLRSIHILDKCSYDPGSRILSPPSSYSTGQICVLDRPNDFDLATVFLPDGALPLLRRSELVLNVSDEVPGGRGHPEEGGGPSGPTSLSAGGLGRQGRQGREIQILVLILRGRLRLILHQHHDIVLLLGRRRRLAPRSRAVCTGVVRKVEPRLRDKLVKFAS